MSVAPARSRARRSQVPVSTPRHNLGRRRDSRRWRTGAQRAPRARDWCGVRHRSRTSGWLAARGALIAGVDRDEDELDRAMRSVGDAALGRDRGGRERRAQVCAAVERAVELLGGLDAVINVAGIGGYTGDVGATTVAAGATSSASTSPASFSSATAPSSTCATGGGGAIVNVGSQYGSSAASAAPRTCAAQAGVVGLTRAMALDHAAREHPRQLCLPRPRRHPAARCQQCAERLA